jgi:thiamine-monophosphate kinase
MQLSKIGEFGLIKNLRAKCADGSPKILVGIGDDAAVIKTTAQKTLITSDMMIEGVHFDLAFTTFHQLGYKLLAINISDIFAMGGNPEYFLVSLGIPKTYKSRDIDELYSGIQKIAGKFGIAVVGGDTCASRQGLVLSGTLTGSANKVITRTGAKQGDGIFVTNTLGDSAAGLQLLKKGGRKVYKFSPAAPRLRLVKSHLMPEPSPLKSLSGITSMIDISDGLLMDLSRICDESKVGAVIHKDSIPVSGELRAAAKSLNKDPLTFALKGGEDYVLLFTARPGIKTDAFRIGEIIRRGRFIADSAGKKTPFKAEGYEHFK